MVRCAVLAALRESCMNRPARHVTTCPDCGGILQSIVPEALTSADVERDAPRAPAAPRRQCLICGYEDTQGRDPGVLTAV
jgi:hypothetical protein